MCVYTCVYIYIHIFRTVTLLLPILISTIFIYYSYIYIYTHTHMDVIIYIYTHIRSCRLFRPGAAMFPQVIACRSAECASSPQFGSSAMPSSLHVGTLWLTQVNLPWLIQARWLLGSGVTYFVTCSVITVLPVPERSRYEINMFCFFSLVASKPRLSMPQDCAKAHRRRGQAASVMQPSRCASIFLGVYGLG